MEGWIKLQRKILDNPIVCKDSDYFSIWCYLLLNATHTEYDSIFGKNRMTLKAGQLITGRKVIANHFKIDESKVQRVLKFLENEHQIEQQTSNKNRLITIVNWSLYQANEQQITQEVNNNCTTTEHIQECKNKKNDKKEINNIKEAEEVWASYPNKKGKAKAIIKINRILKNKSKDVLLKCIERYKDQIEEDRKKFKDKQYQNGDTFFNGTYIDYLDENYLRAGEQKNERKIIYGF